ncbi:MAG: hypothetical protein ACI9EW_004045 [Cellvibrionaceae bacterium]|jgi:hypothetical protein
MGAFIDSYQRNSQKYYFLSVRCSKQASILTADGQNWNRKYLILVGCLGQTASRSDAGVNIGRVFAKISEWLNELTQRNWPAEWRQKI